MHDAYSGARSAPPSPCGVHRHPEARGDCRTTGDTAKIDSATGAFVDCMRASSGRPLDAVLERDDESGLEHDQHDARHEHVDDVRADDHHDRRNDDHPHHEYDLDDRAPR